MNKFYRGWELIPDENGRYYAEKRGIRLFKESYEETFVRRWIDKYEFIDFQTDIRA